MMSGNPETLVESPSWADFERWNVLFETLCNIRGFAAASDLAHAYCDRTNKQTQRALDAAVRSINNWRSGSHTPSARNLAVLAQILDVASDPALQDAWLALYRKAKTEPEAAPAIQSEGSSRGALFPVGQQRAAYLVTALAVIAAFAGGFIFWQSESPLAEEPSAKADLPIPFRQTVMLAVGQNTVIHGHRGNCGQPAPEKDETTALLPVGIGIGTLTAGDIGVRYSRHCGGNTAAREVIFHAERVGSEKIELFDDVITVIVTE